MREERRERRLQSHPLSSLSPLSSLLSPFLIAPLSSLIPVSLVFSTDSSSVVSTSPCYAITSPWRRHRPHAQHTVPRLYLHLDTALASELVSLNPFLGRSFGLAYARAPEHAAVRRFLCERPCRWVPKAQLPGRAIAKPWPLVSDCGARAAIEQNAAMQRCS